MRGSSVLLAMALLTAILDYLSGKATDVDHLAGYIVLCASFVVRALEDLRADK